MESQDLACGAARPLLRREEKGVLGPEGGSAVCSLAVVEDLARAAGRRVGRPRGEAACGGAAGVSPLTDPRSDWGSGRECANGEGPWRETAGGTPSACSCVGDGRPQLPWAGREAPWGEPGFLGGWPGPLCSGRAPGQARAARVARGAQGTGAAIPQGPVSPWRRGRLGGGRRGGGLPPDGCLVQGLCPRDEAGEQLEAGGRGPGGRTSPSAPLFPCQAGCRGFSPWTPAGPPLPVTEPWARVAAGRRQAASVGGFLPGPPLTSSLPK